MNADIVDIFADVVAKMQEDYTMIPTDKYGNGKPVQNVPINYIFGSPQYIKDKLDEYSRTDLCEKKFPLVGLFCPLVENRDSADYATKANVNLIIACSSCKEWSNEERLHTSFHNILRPIYRRMLDVLRADKRFDFGYDGVVPHTYSENYSYGRYGAYTESGDAVSEPIDAINIRSLEIIINNIKCNKR